jgi:serine/threonine-protein kinase RsbW/stage II sporulation protein AB (anti-sigma F factor)
LCNVASSAHRLADLRDAVDVDADLIYERLLPAAAANVGQIRRELADVLRCLNVGSGRLDDIALVVTEAATNVVLHAYVDRVRGPLYAAAALCGRTLTVTVADCGRGSSPRTDSPGLGFGMPLMAGLTDRLQVTPNPSGDGTRVVAAFEHATGRPHVWPTGHAVPAIQRAELLCDYARALIADTARLQEETHAILAEARQTRRRARSRRRGT